MQVFFSLFLNFSYLSLQMTIRKTDVILSVLQSAANLLITMIASGNHTSIHPEGTRRQAPAGAVQASNRRRQRLASRNLGTIDSAQIL